MDRRKVIDMLIDILRCYLDLGDVAGMVEQHLARLTEEENAAWRKDVESEEEPTIRVADSSLDRYRAVRIAS
jgi:hypothetical protein